MTPRRNEFDAAYTAALIDTVFKFRGLGDGTAYINDETERLLSSYVSLYLQISFSARDQIEKLRNTHPFTAESKAAVDSLAASAGKYLEMGMIQFPKEWRNYWAAAFVYQAAGMKKEAMEVTLRGLQNVPSYEEGGLARLNMAVRQIELLPDEPLKVEETAPAADSAKAGDSTAAGPAIAAAN